MVLVHLSVSAPFSQRGTTFVIFCWLFLYEEAILKRSYLVGTYFIAHKIKHKQMGRATSSCNISYGCLKRSLLLKERICS